MFRTLATRIALSTLLLFAPSVYAGDDPETPTTLSGGKILSVSDVSALAGKAAFFDMRKAISYGKGHLPGAQPLPYNQKSDKTESFDASMDSFDMSQLPTDKSAAIVFYSDGPTGWKSYKASVIAIRAGYTNVMWFRGGTDEWKKKGMTFAQ